MANKDVENDYRSERKERLAKSAKKKNKKHLDSTDIISRVITVVGIIALVVIICAGLYIYGVPQKFIPAIKVDGRTYTAAEYNYYYSSVYQTYANQAYTSVQNYGINISGFDYTKDPSTQKTTDDDGNEITYDQFFKNYVEKTLESYNYYLKLIKEEGVTLSEENQTTLNDRVSEIESLASEANYSADRYISTLYGKGLTLKKFKALLEEQLLVAQYVESLNEKLAADISDEEINAEYEKDPSDYQLVDIRLLGITITDNKETAAENETAEETLAAEETEAVEETEAAKETEAAEETEAAKETEAAEETEAVEETKAAEETETKADTEEEKTPSLQEKLAYEMLDKITDEASFIKLSKEYASEENKELFEKDAAGATLRIGIKKNVVKSNIGDDIADWLFSSERKVGDKTVCVTKEYAFVVYMIKTAYRNDEPLVNARHILVSFETIAKNMLAEDENADTKHGDKDETGKVSDTDSTKITNKGTDYSLEVVRKTYERAAQILDEYNMGLKTEDSFATLADTYSEDTNSNGSEDAETSGGLYSDIERGTYVQAFEDWVYDSARQPGDTDIIMSSYGWHIMYFVSANEEASWSSTIRASLASDKETERDKNVAEQTKDDASVNFLTDRAAKEALKLINKRYANAG